MKRNPIIPDGWFGIRGMTGELFRAALFDAINGGSETWTELKALVDSGNASTQFPVGAQIETKWRDSSNKSYRAAWDVAHYNEDGDLSLCWHYTVPTRITFDAQEAVFYAPSGGIAAGTYHIGIGNVFGLGWQTTRSIQFTLISDMDEGDQFCIDCGRDNTTNPADGRTWNVYAKGSTVSKQSGTTSDGTDGTSLGTIGATSTYVPEGNLNSIARVCYGYGRWSQSALRQWLNSSSPAGSWWTAQNPWDRPPAEALTERGFLAGYGSDFLAAIAETDVITAVNSFEGIEEQFDITRDKVFIPSLENWYVTPDVSGEGEQWDYYKSLAAEAGLSGMFLQSRIYNVLKKYPLDNPASAVTVRMRSCGSNNPYTTHICMDSGSVSASNAQYYYRCCPACIIAKE